VATFYTMYKRNPTGEYLVSVCTNTLCGMLGGDEIYAALREHLGVGNNETTADGAITLEHAECLAACDYAPVVTVNYEFFDNQTVEGATQLVEDLRGGRRPMPTRGAPLCTFRQIERQIAGFHDDAALAVDAVSAGVPTEVGVKLAIQRGDTAPSYAVDHREDDRTDASAGRATPQEARATGGAKQDSLFEDSDEQTAPERQPAGSRTSRRTGQAAREAGEGSQPTSQHDAPLETYESDPNYETGNDDA
jgi:NADH-quinone oxidoreductase subunit E